MRIVRSATCPDWRALADSRDHEEARSGSEWVEALEHLDGGCPACRDAAYAADPTLVFRRAPAIETAPGEIADLQASVRAMIRAGRIEGATTPPPEAVFAPLADEPTAARRRPALRWRAASLAAGVVALLIGTAPDPVGNTGSEGSGEVVASAAFADGAFADGGFAAVIPAYSRGAGGDPVEIETLDRPSANVYQFDDPGMDVVLIVDAGLDV